MHTGTNTAILTNGPGQTGWLYAEEYISSCKKLSPQCIKDLSIRLNILGLREEKFGIALNSLSWEMTL